MPYGPVVMSWCPSLIVTVPLQLPARCTRAQTANRRPHAVSAAPIQNAAAGYGRSRTSKPGIPTRGTANNTAATDNATTCDALEAADSRRTVALVPTEARIQ